MKHRPPHHRCSGLTLIELLLGLVVMGVLVMLAAPSFKRMIDTQRVRSINAALITDLQYARAEANSRNRLVKLRFDKVGGSLTCYVILVGDSTSCNCQNQPGVNVCAGSTKELRTVQVERSLGITLGVPDSQSYNRIAFDPYTGRLQVATADVFQEPPTPFKVEVSHADVGGFVNSLEATGRPSSCSPSGRISGVPAC